MKRLLLSLLACGSLLGFSLAAQAASPTLILKTDFRIWEVSLEEEGLLSSTSKVYLNKIPVSLAAEEMQALAPYLSLQEGQGVDRRKLEEYLRNQIAPQIDRPAEHVTIKKDAEGKVAFEGRGFYGRKLLVEQAAEMIAAAAKSQVDFVHLPLEREQPKVTVLDEELKTMGIKELVSAGETDFSRSPPNRIVNIKVGLRHFNGHIVKPGEELVFGQVLGPVEGSTGFLPELVIKGNKTIPEFGGGLCQISTTAYRAALAAGFPITQRQNHSYNVSYYAPSGTDATIYPPTVDMRFVNDSPTHLLMQAFTVEEGGVSKVYYNYYGTKENRKVTMVGPHYHSRSSVPGKKVEYTDTLPPGQVKVVGHGVPGLKVSWYRQVQYQDDAQKSPQERRDFLEHIYSNYQARPDYFLIGGSDPNAAPAISAAVSDIDG